MKVNLVFCSCVFFSLSLLRIYINLIKLFIDSIIALLLSPNITFV